jgi:zinc protease
MSLDRKMVPTIQNASEFDFVLPPITETQLANGIPFYYFNGGTQEVLNIELVFDAGAWQQPKTAVAMCAMALLKSGTSTKSAFQLNEQIEQYGASVKCNAGTDFSNVVISCLSRHVSVVLPLLLEMITDSAFAQNELEIYKQNTIQRMRVNEQKSDIVANRHIDALLYGIHHPYGVYNEIADIEAITSQDLQAFVHEYISYNRCKIFLAGLFSHEVLKDVETIFGSSKWNDGVVNDSPNFMAIPHPEKKHRIQMPTKGVQGSIRLSSPFVLKNHQDFVPMIIVNTLFGGYFGSRLMTNIREDKGFTYGIYSYVYNNKMEGGYGITTEAGADVCEEAVLEIYKEMEKMRNAPPTAEELQLVKNYILGGLVGDLDGPFQIITRWKNLKLYGFGKERFDTNIQMYKNISPKQVQELANIYLQPSNFYELIVS